MRIVLLVIDSGGIGEAPDSSRFGDSGSNTLGHVIDAVGDLEIPHLETMGLGRLLNFKHSEQDLLGVAYKVFPQANGKDTLAGHWEMMGESVVEPFQTFPQGFPDGVVRTLIKAFGRNILGNEAASGTEIIQRLGEEHLRTGYPIVYTSADSVLQIAAHDEVVPLDTLYLWCQQARDIMQGPYRVGRVIARPFTGAPGHFVRTPDRHDFTVKPPAHTMVDGLQQSGVETIAIGKIGDIFSGQGFVRVHPTRNNLDGLEKTHAELENSSDSEQFIFVNLVDFDSRYGHRRDVRGYAQALRELDSFLPRLWDLLRNEDQLWITADHGCDPTFRGTDHTREALPWLAYGRTLHPCVGSPRYGLGDVAATLAALWGLAPVGTGKPAQELLPS